MLGKLKLPRVQNRKVELLHHLRTLPTVPAMSVGDVCRRPADLVIIRFNMINVTEHSSPPSLPTPFAKWLLLSSLCRMETAPGFSPWKLLIPHCGKPCLAFNFPINNFSQHLFARARNCRGWCHDAYSDMGRCYQLVATLTLRGNTHTQIIPNPSQSSKHLISRDNCKKKSCLRISMSQMEAELKLPLVQNSQSRGYAALTHAANCASNVCGQMADFLVPWLNLVRCGPCLLCLPRAGWKQLPNFHHGN